MAATFNYIGTAVDDVTGSFDDVQLPGRDRNAPGGDSSSGEKLFFSADGSRIHSYYQQFPSSGRAIDMVVDAAGVATVISGSRGSFDLELAGGSLYSNNREYDAETYVILGEFGWAGRNIAIDSVNRRFYSESYDELQVWELDRRLPIATYDLGLEYDSVRRIEMAGDFLVLVRDNDLRILDTTAVEPVAAEDCVATALQTSEGDTFTQYACDMIDAIYDPVADRIWTPPWPPMCRATATRLQSSIRTPRSLSATFPFRRTRSGSSSPAMAPVCMLRSPKLNCSSRLTRTHKRLSTRGKWASSHHEPATTSSPPGSCSSLLHRHSRPTLSLP